MNYKETKQFLEDNKEKIIGQYIKKFTKIFKNCENDYDRKNIWWMKIVEPGWTCDVLKDDEVDIFQDDNTQDTMNVLIDILDNYTKEALSRMEINVDIIY